MKRILILAFILLAFSGCSKDNKIRNVYSNIKSKIFRTPIETNIEYELYMPAIERNFAEAPIEFK